MVVVAGYKDHNKPRWLNSDGADGLSRRFPMKLELPNYSPEELVLIAEKMLTSHKIVPCSASLDEGARAKLQECAAAVAKASPAANAGGMETLLKYAYAAIKERAVMIQDFDSNNIVFTAADMGAALEWQTRELRRVARPSPPQPPRPSPPPPQAKVLRC